MPEAAAGQPGPLDDAASAEAFLATRARRWFADRIPSDRRYWVCLASAGEVGGAADVAGIGETRAAAVLRCTGELLEVLAQASRPAVAAGADVPWLEGPRGCWWEEICTRAGPETAQAVLLGGGVAGVPAGLIWRGSAARPDAADPPLSEGCAAGRGAAQAQCAAVLELVERDAVAAWWLGGRPARLVERATVQRLGGAARVVVTLDLGRASIAPVAAVFSTTPEGTGFAFAAAARPGFAGAQAAACRELALFEMAQAAARAAVLAGRGPLRAEQQAHRDRATCADALGLLGPLDETLPPSDDLGTGHPADHLAELATRAARAEVRVALVDLSRDDIGGAAFKALSPDLLPSRSRIPAAQLLLLRQDNAPPAAGREYLLPY